MIEFVGVAVLVFIVCALVLVALVLDLRVQDLRAALLKEQARTREAQRFAAALVSERGELEIALSKCLGDS